MFSKYDFYNYLSILLLSSLLLIPSACSSGSGSSEGTVTIAPVITLLGANPMHIDLGNSFSDPGATAMDDIDGDITSSIQSYSNVDTEMIGTYMVIYSVTDSNKNTTEAVRMVIVVDTIAPVISLIGDNPLSLNVGDTFKDPGATAQDIPDGDLTALIQRDSDVNADIAGT